MDPQKVFNGLLRGDVDVRQLYIFLEGFLYRASGLFSSLDAFTQFLGCLTESLLGPALAPALDPPPSSICHIAKELV